MQNFLKKTKNNDYFKLYIRLLKEKKLYNEEHKKNYLSEERLKKYPNCGNNRMYLKNNSIMFNIEIPNMLIANEIPFHDFVLLYNHYNRSIAPSIAMQIINKLCKAYDVKLTNEEKQEKQKLLVNFLKTKLFFDSIDDKSFIPIEDIITKILTKTRTLINGKIKRETLENILFNSINNKIISNEI